MVSSDDLILLCMTMEHNSNAVLSRIWVIEALACSKQCYIPGLIDLIVRTPELSTDIGKNARELVCLKILETLSALGDQNNNEDPSDLHQKLEFDPLDTCQDVLGHILQEISASNFKLDASKMLKWDVEPFIAHKRECLPVFTLQKVKDVILEGSHSVFASLKEQGGLDVRAQFSDISPALSVSPSASGQLLELSNKDIQIVCSDQNTCSKTPESRDGKLVEKFPGRHSLLSKRKMIDISAENLEREDQIMQYNSYDALAESRKKFKQGTHITENTGVPKLIKLVRDGLLANFSERIRKYIDKRYNSENKTEVRDMEVSHTEYPFDAAQKLEQIVNVTEHVRVVKYITAAGDEPLPNSSGKTVEHNGEGCSLKKEAAVGGMDMTQSDSAYKDGDRCASAMLARGSEISYVSDGNGLLQNPTNEKVEVNIPTEVQGRNNCTVKVNDQMEVFEEKASNGASLGANADHDNVNEAKNSCHPNVQGNTSSGREANDGIEHNRVFEAAIDHVNFHDERNDIASKKKAFLASQCTVSEDSLATQSIFCLKCYGGGQLLTCGSSTCTLVVHESCLGTAANIDGDGRFYCPFCMYSRAVSECLEAKNKATCARKDLATFMDQKVACQPQIRRSPRLNKVRQVDGILENNEANVDRGPVDEVVHSQMRPNVAENLQTKPSKSVSGNDHSSGQTAAHSTHGYQEISKNANLLQLVSYVPSKPLNKTTSESFEEDVGKSSSKYSMRSRRQEMQSTYSPCALTRRQRCHWTKLEEEKLKEGVEKLCSDMDIVIPWKAILEYGAGVFEENRTASDLKSKWRNLSKGGGPRSG